jgi:hypothetical protein
MLKAREAAAKSEAESGPAIQVIVMQAGQTLTDEARRDLDARAQNQRGPIEVVVMPSGVRECGMPGKGNA